MNARGICRAVCDGSLWHRICSPAGMRAGASWDFQSRAADQELIRDVRHAAGNLVQRIQYWSVLLEDEAEGAAAQESLAGLRTSLDCLHRLVVRSLDLLRVIETRPIEISLRDIITAMTLRFSCVVEDAALDSEICGACAAELDPLVLERAIAMLSEVLSADSGANDRTPLAVELSRGVARDVIRDGAVHDVVVLDAVVHESPEYETYLATLRLRARRRSTPVHDPFAVVHSDVTLALALKLLSDIGCDGRVDEEDDAFVLRITFPLSRPRMHATHNASRHESLAQLPL